MKIFEAASQPGGMLRLALPPYRLPNEVVDEDVANVTDVGVKIVTDTRVDDLEALKARATTPCWWPSARTWPPSCASPARICAGVMRAADFLQAAKLGEELEVEGKRVVVIGGGNVAIDVARTALRLKAASVQVLSLESHEQMPAHPREIEEAQAEGVTFKNSCGVREFEGEDSVRSVELMRCVSVFDDEGTLQPAVRRRHAWGASSATWWSSPPA